MTLAELVNYANEGIASESRNKRLSPGRAIRAIADLYRFFATWSDIGDKELEDLDIKTIIK